MNCKFYQGVIFGCHFCKKHGKIPLDYCGLCPDKKAKQKYNNTKTEVDGIKFDSKKESNRFLELKMLEKSEIIENLERQKRFEIVPKTKDERAVFYVADFVYKQDGRKICEDVKSEATRKDKTYIIKRKLFKYLYPDYIFLEI